MYDMDAPPNIMCVYDMNVFDVVYKLCLGTWPTQPQRVKHVTFIGLLNLTTHFTEYKYITFTYHDMLSAHLSNYMSYWHSIM